jgi:hypothetical protein
MSEVASPDAAGVVVGWRAWAVVSDRGRFRLASVIARTIWQPRRVVEATCLRPGNRFLNRWLLYHEAPRVGCACGVYAADAATAASYASGGVDDPEPRVFGQVALWGLVAECEHGWRASQAYPCRIVVPERPFLDNEAVPLETLALDLTDYCVPVTIADPAEVAVLAEALE